MGKRMLSGQMPRWISPDLCKSATPSITGCSRVRASAGGQRPGFQRQVMRQRHALLALLNAVDGVVLLDHVHNAGKPGGRRQPVQIVVQVLKVHPAGLEQHLAPGLGHQRAVGAAAVAQRHGEIFLDAHKPLFLVVHAAVAQPVAVGAQVFANGVFACQLGAKGQRALRVFVVQALAAMGALAMEIHLDRLQAVRAGDLLLHKCSFHDLKQANSFRPSRGYCKTIARWSQLPAQAESHTRTPSLACLCAPMCRWLPPLPGNCTPHIGAYKEWTWTAGSKQTGNRPRRPRYAAEPAGSTGTMRPESTGQNKIHWRPGCSGRTKGWQADCWDRAARQALRW